MTRKELIIAGGVPEGMTAEKAAWYRGQWQAAANPEDYEPVHGLTAAEIAQIADNSDPTLIGNRIAEFTKLFGIPPCGSCGSRQRWLNKAHQWLRGTEIKKPQGPMFVTTKQLTDDVYSLAQRLPANISGIVGVARSGVMPAALLAMHRHLPLWILREDQGDLIDAGHGWRLSQHQPGQGPLLVVDDTVMTGRSVRLTNKVLAKYPEQKFLRAVIYKNPTANVPLDYWVTDLPHPHFLEWNLFNSIHLPRMAFDFDGVLCHDGIANPNYLPRKGTIPLIVTGRSERHRASSIAWLAHWGVKIKKMVMWTGTDEEFRKPLAISNYKAKHFLESGLDYFVESCPLQAKEIAGISKKPVICPIAGKVF